MRYEIFKPAKPLEPYVEYFWLLIDNAPADSNAELVLPDGRMELIVHFGDNYSVSRGDRFALQHEHCLLAGQITERIFLKPNGATGMIAARFKPFGAAKFFAFPLHEVVDQITDLDSFVKGASAPLAEKILNAASDLERVHHLETFLVDHLRKNAPDDLLVRQACRYIAQSAGEYRVANLASLVGLSERQLERRFLSQIGISPKLLSRIHRFQRFVAISKNHHLPSLTDAAHMCGYYDQAHFIRDFKSFSGISPSQFLAQDTVLNDFFTSDSDVGFLQSE